MCTVYECNEMNILGCKQPIKFKARPVFGWEKWLKVYQKVQTNSPQNCADFCYSDGSCQAAIYFRGDCHLSYRTIGCDTSSTKGLETIYESGRSVLLYCIVCMNDLPAWKKIIFHVVKFFQSNLHKGETINHIIRCPLFFFLIPTAQNITRLK